MRFVWMYKWASQGASTPPDGTGPYLILDLEAADADPGEVRFFAECPDRTNAVMTCMGLNGSWEASES